VGGYLKKSASLAPVILIKDIHGELLTHLRLAEVAGLGEAHLLSRLDNSSLPQRPRFICLAGVLMAAGPIRPA